MSPSILREILKVAERPGVRSMAGGLPSPDTFPVDALARRLRRRACRHTGREALQYASSEGFLPLREWVVARLGQAGTDRSPPTQVLITTGSQQGLDLVGKVLIDAGAPVAVEAPTYLGALQAYVPYQPTFVEPGRATATGRGPNRSPICRAGRRAPASPTSCRTSRIRPACRFPATGATRWSPRRSRPGCRSSRTTPTATCGTTRRRRRRSASRWPEGCVYLGSFSKVLTPGFRLGYIVAPRGLYPKLLSAKQAADLHTPGFNQRVVYEVVKDGFLDRHVPTIRDRYRVAAGRDGRRPHRAPAGRHHVADAARRHVLLAAAARGLRRDGAARQGGRRRRRLRARRAVLRHRSRSAHHAPELRHAERGADPRGGRDPRPRAGRTARRAATSRRREQRDGGAV